MLLELRDPVRWPAGAALRAEESRPVAPAPGLRAPCKWSARRRAADARPSRPEPRTALDAEDGSPWPWPPRRPASAGQCRAISSRACVTASCGAGPPTWPRRRPAWLQRCRSLGCVGTRSARSCWTCWRMRRVLSPGRCTALLYQGRRRAPGRGCELRIQTCQLGPRLQRRTPAALCGKSPRGCALGGGERAPRGCCGACWPLIVGWGFAPVAGVLHLWLGARAFHVGSGWMAGAAACPRRHATALNPRPRASAAAAGGGLAAAGMLGASKAQHSRELYCRPLPVHVLSMGYE